MISFILLLATEISDFVNGKKQKKYRIGRNRENVYLTRELELTHKAIYEKDLRNKNFVLTEITLKYTKQYLYSALFKFGMRFRAFSKQ